MSSLPVSSGDTVTTSGPEDNHIINCSTERRRVVQRRTAVAEAAKRQRSFDI